jgi:hypothetical protein
MKDLARLTRNTLIIKSSRAFIWIATFSGLAFLIGGIYLIFRDAFGGHITFSAGMILSSLGLLFFVNSRYYKIYINTDPGYISILESTFTSIAPFKIPIRRYSIISIQTRIVPAAKKRMVVSYEIILMNEFGSSLHVAEFSEKDQAMTFARNLQDLTGRDLYIDNTPVIKNVKMRDIPAIRLAVDLPEKCRVSRKLVDNTMVLKWKKRFTFFQYFFFVALIYGVFHFFNFVLFSDEILSLLRHVVYGFAGAALAIVALTVLLTNTGTFVLSIDRDTVSHYWQFMGKWIGYHELKREDILMVKNTFDMNDNHLEVIDRNTLDFLNRLVADFKGTGGLKAPAGVVVQKLIQARKRIMRLDVSSLSISEKFFIEEMLLRD